MTADQTHIYGKLTQLLRRALLDTNPHTRETAISLFQRAMETHGINPSAIILTSEQTTNASTQPDRKPRPAFAIEQISGKTYLTPPDIEINIPQLNQIQTKNLTENLTRCLEKITPGVSFRFRVRDKPSGYADLVFEDSSGEYILITDQPGIIRATAGSLRYGLRFIRTTDNN